MESSWRVKENLAGKRNVSGIVVANGFDDRIKSVLAIKGNEVRFLFRSVWRRRRHGLSHLQEGTAPSTQAIPGLSRA